MRRPSTRGPLDWRGTVACFAVLSCGLWSILSQTTGKPDPNCYVLGFGGLLLLTPLCFLCHRPSLVQLIFTEVSRCIQAFANRQRPRTDP